MTVYVYYLAGLAALLLVIFFAWRLASRRETLPCPTWLGWLVEQDNPLFRNNRASAIVQQLELRPGMKVVDLGCGPGRLTIPIARQVGPRGEVVAMDIQAGMLQRTRAKAQAANLDNIRYVQAGIGEGRLAHAEYDRAVLVTVLGEIPDRRSALKEVFAALKPDGLLVVTELIADPHFQRQSTVRELAGAVGFREHGCSGNRAAYTLSLVKPGAV